jgi:DNA-binding SARP family transcriptional activator
MDAVCFQWSLVVKPTTLSQHGSSLLNYAVSKLNPEIFSHPVWVRFGKQEVSGCLDLIGDLLSATKGLERDDPGGACQILLICSVYQNYAGQQFNALRTTRRALALADHASFARETIWALWGAGAISYQQGDYEQAANHFADLQAVLIKQNEWILADFVDVLKQSLFQPMLASAGKHSGSPRDPPPGDLLALTFDWLQQWGRWAQTCHSEPGVISRHPASHVTIPTTSIRSFFSIQRWQDHWRTLVLAMRGGLKMQGAENDAPRKKRRFSFWRSLLSSPGMYPASRNMDAQVPARGSPIVNTSVLPPANESLAPHISFPNPRTASTSAKGDVDHLSRQATTFIPVAVHMLGTFSLIIGDLTVKLPPSRGLSVLKYLLLHHKQNTSREVLMDIFWPDAEPETARNNLNVAIHGLRTALRTVVFLPVIIFEGGAYRLAPDLQVWLDVEEFERCVKTGQRLDALHQLAAAAAEYEAAISLYQGDFLDDHPYEGWTMLDREHFRIAYLDTLDRLSQIYFDQERYAACIAVSQRILTRDRCREDTHCLLIRCFSHQGQYHLALRQYQNCVEALQTELDIDPTLETTQLYERIRRHERV